jgi:hypothetical protein
LAVKIKWKGKQVIEKVQSGLSKGLVKWGLRVEGDAKRSLQPSEQDEGGNWVPGGGHGVRTGTLRRSIHLADPGYNWQTDNVAPSTSSPEKGGQTPTGKVDSKGKVTVQLGSGLEYAQPVHQGWSRGSASFEGYHFLQNAIEKNAPFLEGDLQEGVKSEGIQ